MSGNLAQYYRIPKINIKLPSDINYYKQGFIELSTDGSLPIRAMTAIDERMLKSPDALLNGDCIVNIIKSCCPEISDPKKLLAPDVEAILLGIFYASYGPRLKFSSACPECEHENEFELEIRDILTLMKKINFPTIVELDLGTVNNTKSKFQISVRPYNFETNNRHQMAVFQQAKMMQVLSKDDLDDQEKLKAFNECFEKIVKLKFENIQDCIISFKICELIQNEWIGKEITDAKEIQDFIFNAEKSLVDPIIDKIDELNQTGVQNTYNTTCTKCGHKWDARIEFNPVNFFGPSSSSSNPLKL